MTYWVNDETCPECKGIISSKFLNDKDINMYIGAFNCPNCGIGLECEYDEAWDGENETHYFSLKVNKGVIIE